jgi:hypothetical protein
MNRKSFFTELTFFFVMLLSSGLIFAQSLPKKKVIILDKKQNNAGKDNGRHYNNASAYDRQQYEYDYSPPSSTRGVPNSLYEKYGDTEFITMPYKIGGNYRGSKTYFIINGKVVNVYDSHPGSHYLYNQR